MSWLLFRKINLCQVEVCAEADHLSRGVLLTVVCLSVIAKPHKGETIAQNWVGGPQEK